MPIITLRTNRTLPEEIMARLANDLSSLTEHILRKSPEVIVVRFESNEAKRFWYVNSTAKSSSLNIFELDIVVTAGTNSPQEKSEWIKQCWVTICDAIGERPSGPNYISVREIEGNNWGYNGLTQHQRKVNQTRIKEA